MNKIMKRKQLSIMFLAIFSSGAAWADDASVADISPVTTLPPELSYYFNWYQPMVGAKTAYTMGARGKGIVVGVIDTGIDLNNSQFKGRIVPGYNAISPGSLPMDDNGHGTHVAGIIGAAADGVMTVGIAPDVSLMPVKILNASGSGTQSSFNAGVNYAIQNGARILNMSLGASGPFGQTGIQQAVSAGRLVVAAAGNSGLANPAWPARYAKETWANGQVIAVGAVDKNGVIASWSNRAGDTKNFFVVAPGVNIASTYLNNQYVYMSGTSMATPVVSGVAADIWSYWMYLKANQVSSIIFQTATHLGTSPIGTPDAVYGWGLVNLTKALQPVGTLTLSTQSGNKTYTLAASTFSTNSLLKSSSFNGLPLTATDDFGRAYSYDLGAYAIKPAITDIENMFGSMDKQMSMVERTSQNSSLTLSMYGAPAEMQKLGNPFRGPDMEGATMAGFNFVQKFGCHEDACQGEYALGSNGFAGQYFGVSADYKRLPISNSFTNPYFQFASTASHLAVGYGLGDGYKLKMGMLSAANPMANQPMLSYSSGSKGWVGEIEKRFDGATILATVGGVRESQSMLGATGTAAFGMDAAQTRFVSISGSYRMTSATSLLAQASTGTTSAFGGGIIQNSEARTLSWSLGMLRENAWRKDDKLALSVAQPMKVTSGNMNLSLPTVDMTTGQGGFNLTSVGLASDRAETDFEVGYMTPVSKASVLRFISAYKLNANNDPGNAKVVAARYQIAF